MARAERSTPACTPNLPAAEIMLVKVLLLALEVAWKARPAWSTGPTSSPESSANPYTLEWPAWEEPNKFAILSIQPEETLAAGTGRNTAHDLAPHAGRQEPWDRPTCFC